MLMKTCICPFALALEAFVCFARLAHTVLEASVVFALLDNSSLTIRYIYKEGKRGNIGCEADERLGEEGKRGGGEEEFSVGEFS